MSKGSMLARISQLSHTVEYHQHIHHQVIIGIKGESSFNIEGELGQIDKYSGCIIPSNESHSFYGSENNEVFILDVQPNAASVLGQPVDRFNHICESLFASHRYFPIDQQMHFMLLSLDKELTVCRTDSDIKLLVAELILRSLYNRLITLNAPGDYSLGYNRLNLTLVQQYVHAHIDEKIQISDLAKVCDLSESYFYKKFREKMGVSPHQYIIDERMKIAKFLLKNTNKPLTDICFSLGFSSQSAFTNTFTKNTGCSPSQYRIKNSEGTFI